MTPYLPHNRNWIRAADSGRITLGDGNVSPWTLATGFAKVCRYGGQCLDHFYSVAQHQVLVAQFAPPEFELEALLHEIGEGVGMGDVVRPWKVEMRNIALHRYREFDPSITGPIQSDYDIMTQKLEEPIAEHYGLKYPWPDVIKEVDTRVYADEVRCLFVNPDHTNDPSVKGYGFNIVPIEDWREARLLWLHTFYTAMARRHQFV